jgi:hypothetical protein
MPTSMSTRSPSTSCVAASACSARESRACASVGAAWSSSPMYSSSIASSANSTGYGTGPPASQMRVIMSSSKPIHRSLSSFLP